MFTGGHEHLTANQFREALLAAPSGGTVVYFTGELGHDLFTASSAKDPGAAELRLVVQMALAGSDLGDLILTQRRIDAKTFEYRATKVRPEFRLQPRFIPRSAEPKRAPSKKQKPAGASAVPPTGRESPESL